MKIPVDIITGFLDSGKTTYLNNMLQKISSRSEKIVVLEFEHGEIEIDDRITKDKNIIVVQPESGETINAEYIKALISEFSPDRIIIEYNGTTKLDQIFSAFEDWNVRKKSYINKIITTIDALTFQLYINNMANILVEQIASSDLIILNKAEKCEEDELENIILEIKAINKPAKIEVAGDRHELPIIDGDLSNSAPGINKYSNLLVYIFITLTILYLLLRAIDFSSIETYLSKIQVVNTVFLSILMQAFPFILVGVFVSSIIQIFISSETVVKLFPRKMGMGYIAAMFAGMLFPVCDCGVVPVAVRLMKKGIPLSTAVTFMLAAPIVNPIVIISTLYAFPNQPFVACYRVLLGLAVALTVGLTFYYSDGQSILLNGQDNLSCKCGCCDADIFKNQGLGGKIRAVFKHAGTEFFEVGKFVIMGAFLSSIVQTTVPKDIFDMLGKNNAIPLLIMMLAAFVLSVCSTSDAFIARTFLNQFSLGSVMGFLVLGPMIDVKNMLMLFSSLKRGFVIRLAAVILGWAFIIIYFVTPLLR